MLNRSLAFLIGTLIVSAAMAQGTPPGKPAEGPDAQAIDVACKGDAAAAKCGSAQVGTGLVKCMIKYKKLNPNYKFSDACKSALEKARTDHRNGKTGG